MKRDDAAAARRFPGPDYYAVLRWIHAELQPETYVEIGVGTGESLRIAAAPTVVAGIDPAPHCDGPGRIFRMTSNAFFARYDLREVLGGRSVSFAFVDGLHLFEQALQDILNLERYCSKNSIIALHDTIPLDEETSARERTTEFYTGDVWKAVEFLRRYRPDLEMLTVQTAPAGLTLIRRSSGRWCRWRRRAACDVPPHRDLVADFCQKIPVQSTRWMGSDIS